MAQRRSATETSEQERGGDNNTHKDATWPAQAKREEGKLFPEPTPLENQSSAGAIREKRKGDPPPRQEKRGQEISTAVHGGGGVAEVQLKPIYMHILLVKDVAEVDADGN